MKSEKKFLNFGIGMSMENFNSLAILQKTSEVEELNGKVQFSSKVHFFGELELNLVHFLAK